MPHTHKISSNLIHCSDHHHITTGTHHTRAHVSSAVAKELPIRAWFHKYEHCDTCPESTKHCHRTCHSNTLCPVRIGNVCSTPFDGWDEVVAEQEQRMRKLGMLPPKKVS